jgi:hypothetical protein
VARPRYPKHDAPLPPPLPPETRTVGQLIAESLKLYQRRFWKALSLGIGPAVVGVGLAAVQGDAQLPLLYTVGALLMTASYIGAIVLATDVEPGVREILVATAAGAIVFVPVPLLFSLFVLPGLAWLALLGLAVPAAILERRSLGRSFARAVELAKADYVHALGSLAALTITALLTSSVLFFLLRGQADAAQAAAAFLSLLVISPVLFLGSALLYFDQAARVRSPSRPKRSRDADLHPALDAHAAGPPDAEREP